MREVIIRLWLYKRGSLKPAIININKDNYFKIKFFLECEIELLRKKFRELKARGIILNVSMFKFPRKNNWRIKKMIDSRKSLLNSEKVMKAIRHKVYKEMNI